MKKLLSASAAIALASLGFAAAPASAAAPAATYSYTMEGNLTDTSGSSTMTPATICSSPAATDLCNISANFGTDANGDFWHWVTAQDNGGGAVLTTPAPFGSDYSIYIKFAIDDEANDTNASDCSDPSSNYSSVFNTSNLTSDYGFYTAGCNPDLYLSTGEYTADTRIGSGEVVEAVITRDNTAAELTIYINYAGGFEESWIVDDTNGDFIIANYNAGSILRLFQDDGLDDSHEGVQEGRLYGLKVWANDVLTLDEIATLASLKSELASTGVDAGQISAISGFSALALVAGAAVVARRRRV